MNLTKRIKKLDVMDLSLIKLSVVAFVLFIISIWPASMTLVYSVHWGWFFVAWIVLIIRPIVRIYR